MASKGDVEGGAGARAEDVAVAGPAEGPGGLFRGLASPTLRPFVVISVSYLLFTVTDGALRMIVLLHAYNKGFSAWQVAVMFTLYEVAGVFTNFLAGIAGARWGIKSTLLAGLGLQVAGIGMLYAWQDGWSQREAVVFVTFAQMLSGVAKDLTKLGGKSVTKLVTPEEKQGRLFRLVSFITGFKNSLKGLGYFLGAAFLVWSYFAALTFLEALVLLAVPWAAVALSSDLGRVKKENLTAAAVFRKNPRVNWLSLARTFLFMSRDMWFEVPLPFFLRDSLAGLGWPRQAVGAFLAGYIILYGQVQSWSPQLVLRPLGQYPANKHHAWLWAALLVPCTAALGGAVQWAPAFRDRDTGAMSGALVAVTVVFAVVFAVNSSIHSYLIVKYSEGDKVAMNVGFYYMANAAGRLAGTLASGALYSFAGDSARVGFAACFWAATGASALASAVVALVPGDEAGGLYCGGVPLVRDPERERRRGAGEDEPDHG